jgi:hypothetical protein
MDLANSGIVVPYRKAKLHRMCASISECGFKVSVLARSDGAAIRLRCAQDGFARPHERGCRIIVYSASHTSTANRA